MRLPAALPALGCCALAVLAGCKSKSRSEGVVIDTTANTATMTANTTAAPSGAAPIRLADVAGRWETRVTPDSGKDTTTVEATLVATADSTGWKMINPNGKTVPLRITSVAGDSIVGEAGPFDSPRRKGVKVRAHIVMRLQGDSLVGHVVAHFATTGPDSVLTQRLVGRRK
jgi:hypothetical protein